MDVTLSSLMSRYLAAQAITADRLVAAMLLYTVTVAILVLAWMSLRLFWGHGQFSAVHKSKGRFQNLR